jgi:hypothetical protein
MKQDLKDVILTRFDSVKNMSSSEITGNANKKLGVKLLLSNSLVHPPFFPLCTVFILTFDFVPSFGSPVTPLTDNSSVTKPLGNFKTSNVTSFLCQSRCQKVLNQIKPEHFNFTNPF